jgi:hypothetical protein
MEIKSPIPQFLPIDGKRNKIYHKGIKKWCTNCFKATHLRAACKSQRVEWLEYVDRFMVNNDLDNSYSIDIIQSLPRNGDKIYHEQKMEVVVFDKDVKQTTVEHVHI